MIIFGPLIVIVGIGFICWLLFTLAVFALPFFVGLTIGIWAFHTGAGVLGGITVGLVAGGVTFGIGQLALAFVPWAWLRLLIILLYVAPATVAGYSATHGIAQIAMPSPTWQTIFAVIGAIAVSVTAFVRFTGNGRARTSRTGLGAGLTPSRRRGGAGSGLRMPAVLFVEHGTRAVWRRISPRHRRIPGVVAGRRGVWPRWRGLRHTTNEVRGRAYSRSLASETGDSSVCLVGDRTPSNLLASLRGDSKIATFPLMSALSDRAHRTASSMGGSGRRPAKASTA